MTRTLRAASPLTFQTPASAGGRWRGWLIGSVSLLAHILLVWSLSFPSPPPAKNPANVIAATLLLAPSPSTEPRTLPQANDASAETDERRKNSPATPQLNGTTKEAPPDEPKVTEPSVQKTTAPSPASPSQASLVQPDQTTKTSANRHIDPRAALDAYMSETQQRAILEDGADESIPRTRQALNTEFSHSTLQQPDEGPAPTRVNCSSGLNKTLALLSRYAGGTLRCTETPDLTPHLEKRLKAHTDK